MHNNTLTMKIRRKIRSRNYNSNNLQKLELGGNSCPAGYTRNEYDECVPIGSTPFDSEIQGNPNYDNAVPSDYTPEIPQVNSSKKMNQPTGNPINIAKIEEDANMMELESEGNEAINFANQIDKQTQMDDKIESEETNRFFRSAQPTVPRENTFGNPIENPEGVSYFNSYAGVDLPTAANIFGQSLGPEGDTGTAIASGAKLLLGLGRNITSGLGTAKRNAEALKDFNKNRRLSMLGESQVLAEDGGVIKSDLENLFGDIEIPMDMESEVDVEVLTGSKVKGTNNGDENVEVEEGEHIQAPGGTPKRVEGKKHSEGGEKMNLENNTEVLSDNLKLNKAQVEAISEDYGFKISTKDTYAKALDKYNKNIGLTDLIEEEESIIKEIKAQKEKAAENSTDEPTLNINLEFLSSKLNDINTQKKELESQSSAVFQQLFQMQEDSKPKEDKEPIQTEFNIGGKVYTSDQIVQIGKEYGLEGERALEIIRKMETGGTTGPGKGTFVRKKIAEAKVASGEWEKIGENQYVQKGSSEGNKVVYTAANDEKVLKSYKQVWDEGLVNKELYPTYDKFVEAAEAYWEENQRPGDLGTSESFPDRFYYSEDLNKVDTETKGLVGTEPSVDVDLNTFGRKYTPSEDGSGTQKSGREDNNTGTEEGNGKEKSKNKGPKFNALLLPENMTLPPTGIQMPLRSNRRYSRLNRTALSAEERLAELNRGVAAAEELIQKLPSGQKEAAITQLHANRQIQADKINSEKEQREDSINLNIDMFNARQQDRQEDADVMDALDYERRAFGALANTESDYRRFFNTVQDRNIRNFNTINSLNLLNQSSENFQFGNNGVEFTGGANLTTEDLVNRARYQRAVAMSNSNSTPKKRNGGRIKRKIKY